MTPIKKNIMLLSLFCILMVVVRILKTDQFSFIFLLWNLFLAYVPYAISKYILRNIKTIPGTKLFIVGSIWLLFLPNAPYMATDLFHLHKREGLPIWYDLVLILLFSITGLYLFFISIQHVVTILNYKLPKINKLLFLTFVFIATSYGVYIGRFLRLNSWDIIHPFGLARQCLSTILYYPRFIDMCSFTIIYSLFLGLIYMLLQNNITIINKKNA